MSPDVFALLLFSLFYSCIVGLFDIIITRISRTKKLMAWRTGLLLVKRRREMNSLVIV